MLGKRPSTTGIYNNGQWWLPHLPDAISLPMAFKDNGYMVMGAGKIFITRLDLIHLYNGMNFIG